MVAKAGSHLCAATALAVLAGAGFGAGSARAQGATCLAAPNGAAPAGTHWYYKTDQATHQKCWYTRPQDQAAAAAPVQTAPSRPAAEPGDAANRDSDAAAAPEEAAPVAVAPTATPPLPERATPPAPAAPRHAAAPITRIPMPAADPRGEQQQPITTATTAMPISPTTSAAPDNVAWPNPPSLPQTAGIAGTGSPFPPPPGVGSPADASGASGPAQTPLADGRPTTDGTSANAAAPAPDAAAQPSTPKADKPSGDSPSVRVDADTPIAAKPPGRISVLLVLAGLIILVIVGMLLRRLVEHALGRRRIIKLARQEPRLMEPVAVPPPMPTLLRHAPSVVPGSAQTAQRASEVESALRQLAHNLRQRRPAANGAATGAIGRSGAAVRS